MNNEQFTIKNYLMKKTLVAALLLPRACCCEVINFGWN
jgi:hypothetical protein